MSKIHHAGLTEGQRHALESELAYIERSISYTFGRAAVDPYEGSDPVGAVAGPAARAKEIRKLLDGSILLQQGQRRETPPRKRGR